MRNAKKLSTGTHAPDEKQDPSHILQRTPNSKLPWCARCKRHTAYHLKVIGHAGGEKEASFYTCDECGGKTWKPTYPLAFNLVSLFIIGFLFWISIYALWDVDKDPRVLMLPVATTLVSLCLGKFCRKNTAHWRQFRVWSKSKESLSTNR